MRTTVPGTTAVYSYTCRSRGGIEQVSGLGCFACFSFFICCIFRSVRVLRVVQDNFLGKFLRRKRRQTNQTAPERHTTRTCSHPDAIPLSTLLPSTRCNFILPPEAHQPPSSQAHEKSKKEEKNSLQLESNRRHIRRHHPTTSIFLFCCCLFIVE